MKELRKGQRNCDPRSLRPKVSSQNTEAAAQRRREEEEEEEEGETVTRTADAATAAILIALRDLR